MKITYDSFHGLKRHFVGGLSEPSYLWLDKAEGVHLGFTGEGVEEAPGGPMLHFGPLPALGEHHRTVRVENRGQERVRLLLKNPTSWLKAKWRDGGEAPRLAGAAAVNLDLSFRDELPEERTLTGVILLSAQAESGDEAAVTLGVHLTTFLKGRFGVYRFLDSYEPKPHDFGRVDPIVDGGIAPYVVTIDSRGTERLRVVFEDLPAWLAAEIDGYPRYGPAMGKFFERPAPVRLQLKPVHHLDFLGPRRATVTMRTDDTRPEWRQVPLEFSACLERERPYVTATAVERVVVVWPDSQPVEIHLANWGLSPAPLEVDSQGQTPGLVVGPSPLPEIPAAKGMEPGRSVLHATITARDVAANARSVQLMLRIAGGDPSSLVVSVPVTVVKIEPETLDFGALRGGERHRQSLRIRASDERPLHLAVRPLPAAQRFLRAAADGATVEVVCQPPNGERPWVFEGPGLEVSEPTLGLRRQVVVRVKVPPTIFGRIFGSSRSSARA